MTVDISIMKSIINLNARFYFVYYRQIQQNRVNLYSKLFCLLLVKEMFLCFSQVVLCFKVS